MRPHKIIPIVLIVAFVVFLMRSSPRGFSTDLSRIGSAPLTAVAVHDVNLVDSTAMMDLVGKLHEAYGDRVLFLVADVNSPRGRDFVASHGVRAATLVLFDAEGREVATVPDAAEGVPVRRAIDAALEGS